jgi:sterol 3beta-glucosyltransferase
MIWLGIRSIINDFRKNKLKLLPIPYLSSQGSLADLPTGYLWSPQLVPKPDGMLQARFSK